MRKIIVKIILKIYAEIRTKISPIIHKKFYKIYTPIKMWDSVKDMNMEDFMNTINSYDYKWGHLHGALDSLFDERNPDYFFQNLERDRDSYDFARIWRLWAEHHNMEAKEVIVTDINQPFEMAHAVTITSEIKDERDYLNYDKEYYLFNYRWYGPFETEEKAINYMTKWYYSPDFVYVNYDCKRKN